jgi:CRISPR/Cas system CMR subunit Cmr4 (Cas7 group RAMP superfamily)
MNSKILTIFTRTPLHVGTGSSVGAIDQPVIRERHTRIPIIPGSALKGVLADLWFDELIHPKKKGDNGVLIDDLDKWVRPMCSATMTARTLPPEHYLSAKRECWHFLFALPEMPLRGLPVR